MKHIDIYTDGACSGNPGPGGWAAVLIYNNIKKEISGYEKNTTNNRMELLAPIKALSILNQPCDVNIYTDSAYVFNAFDKCWLQKWQKNGWKTSSKQPVQNRELWEQLITFANIHNIKWIKVKGHSNNEINNRCDELARNAISKNKKDG